MVFRFQSQSAGFIRYVEVFVMIVASPRYKGRTISSFQEKFFPKFQL